MGSYCRRMTSTPASRTRTKSDLTLATQLWEIYCVADFGRFQLDHETIPDAGTSFHGIAFVPLLTRKMNSSCIMTVKFMRNGKPGEIVHGGDIDNRLKTLFDALRLPEHENEVLPQFAPPRPIEEHLYVCLLEDDSLITELSVHTATIMTPLPRNHVRLIIDVEFRPFDFL